MAAGLLGACGLDAGRSNRVFKVGVLSNEKRFYDALQRDLANLGRASNLELLRGDLLNDYGAHVHEFVTSRVDVIVARDLAATLAARSATRTIPIVFGLVSDPVERGFAASLARPGGNVTGVAVDGLAEATKRVEMFRQALPSVRKPILLFNDDPVDQRIVDGLSAVAKQLGLTFKLVPLPATPKTVGASFLEQAGDAVASGADSLVIVGSAPDAGAEALFGFLAARRIPSIGAEDFVERGGLMAFSFHGDGAPMRPASFVDKILNGARAAELPIFRSFTSSLVVNLKSAAAVRVAIAPSVLAVANRVIH
jgi:putative ABC transport system substrate-binding protein